MSLPSRLICLGAICVALVAFAATPAMASVTPLTITGTSGAVTVSNSGVDGNTVMATLGGADLAPMTFTARFGLDFPVRVVGQESWHCEDASGVHDFASSFDSSWEPWSASLTYQPSQCPAGQTAVYHEVTAQAQETYQYYVFGRGFQTATVSTGNVEFLWIFPQ